MTINDKIKDEKLQSYINREAAKVSALSSGKIDKYESLTSKEILSDQIRVMEQASFTYSPLGRAFEKQRTIEDQEGKERKALEEYTKQLVKYNDEKSLTDWEQKKVSNALKTGRNWWTC